MALKGDAAAKEYWSVNHPNSIEDQMNVGKTVLISHTNSKLFFKYENEYVLKLFTYLEKENQ